MTTTRKIYLALLLGALLVIAANLPEQIERSRTRAAESQEVRSPSEERINRGLGSTYTAFEKTWGRGYRKEATLTAGWTEVHVGQDKKIAFAYSKGFNDFSGRIGSIRGEPWLFRPTSHIEPSTSDFLSDIKVMMPSDSKLVAKYASKKLGWLKEIYVYNSATLAKLPGIDQSLAYYQDADSVGKFFLIVNHDPDYPGHVSHFLLTLGAGETDTDGMEKIPL